MDFQQAAKTQQGGGIRCRLATQVDTHKTADGLAVVDGIFATFIGETETLLHDVHAQHARHPYRRASALACGVAIKRRHLRLQLGPGHQLFKVSQEAISASLLFLAGIFEFGEGLLHARNAHGEGGWLKELSVPRVGTVGYFCSASLIAIASSFSTKSSDRRCVYRFNICIDLWPLILETSWSERPPSTRRLTASCLRS
ncbi:hypothetical protein NCPPB2254_06049 [Pseudomonas syringae pv. persicae]|uniref:Uncharacterized protein n=1 Tax=Pseudomonas syringae pv. persicae TaxID=237306 RepID=A0AB38ENK0_9PSED|nr:hypothetical protein NCPPB2254_06049 [Pseudomonas syringae pv. persicae]